MAKNTGPSLNEINREVKSGNIAPIYFLQGDEPFYIDRIDELLRRHLLRDEERDFNQSIFYGKDARPQDVIDAAQRMPMMAERQLVILREAQSMDRFADLERYVERPSPSTVLVICYKNKTIDGRLKVAKLLKEKAVFYTSKRVYDNEMPRWIENYLKVAGLTIEAKEAELIAEYLGTQLSKVANELDKIVLNLPRGNSVSQTDIQKYIGISKDYNVFELQKAFSYRKADLAMKMAFYFAANSKDHPLPLITASLYVYFSKIYALHGMKGQSPRDQQKAIGVYSSFIFREYERAAKAYNKDQLRVVLRLLYEYDLKSKGGLGNKTSMEELTKELIFLIYQAGEHATAFNR